jgi:hypothetical protein
VDIYIYIYIWGIPLRNPRSRRLRRRSWFDRQGQHEGETLKKPQAPLEGPLMGWGKPHTGGGPRAQEPIIQCKRNYSNNIYRKQGEEKTLDNRMWTGGKPSKIGGGSLGGPRGRRLAWSFNLLGPPSACMHEASFHM